MERDDDFQSEKRNAGTARQTYLITNSQADLAKVPSRKDFGRLVKQCF